MMQTKFIPVIQKGLQVATVTVAALFPVALKADRILFRGASFTHPNAEEIQNFSSCVGRQSDGREKQYIITQVTPEEITAVNPDGKICKLRSFFAEGLLFTQIYVDDGRDRVIEQAWKVSEQLQKESRPNQLVIQIEGGTRHTAVLHVDLDKIQNFFTKVSAGSTLSSTDREIINRLLRTVAYLIRVREVTSDNHATLMQHLTAAMQVAAGASRYTDQEINEFESKFIQPLIVALERDGKTADSKALRQEFDELKKAPRDADFDRKLNLFWNKVFALLVKTNQAERVRIDSERQDWQRKIKELEDQKKKLADDLARCQELLKKMEEANRKQAEEIKQMREVDPRARDLRRVREEIQNRETQISQLEAEILKNENELLRADVGDIRLTPDQKDQIRSRISNAQRDIKKFKSELETLRIQLKGMENPQS